MVWQYRKKNHFKFLRSNSISPRLSAFIDKILDAFARRAVEERPSLLLLDDDPIYDYDDVDEIREIEAD